MDIIIVTTAKTDCGSQGPAEGLDMPFVN